MRDFNFYNTPLPKTLTRLAARDDRIDVIEKVDDSHDDERRYYVGLADGYRWSGYYSTGRNFNNVKDVVEAVRYMIEEGETR